jgi:UDP-N-acetylmuramoyl-tripeptide--D-alanyl-D-alanine ligase
MPRFSYSELLSTAGGEVVTSGNPFLSASLCTDTRTLCEGDFFIPLSGENFDGHAYLEKAFQKGAVGAYVDPAAIQQQSGWQQWPNLIGVQSPLNAYLAVAKQYRQKMNPTVIAITGSSGKTTTKDMLYATLSPLRRTQKTLKNFNNEVGLAQTLLQIEPGTEILIVEMGMRGLGEIEVLSRVAMPDIAIINNVGTAHIGRLGSCENIVKAKLEIAMGLSPGQGILVINADHQNLLAEARHQWLDRLGTNKLITYQMTGTTVLQAFNGETLVFEHPSFPGVSITLSVPGDHMMSNALGVLTVGQQLGLPVEQLLAGLATFRPEGDRWQDIQLTSFSNCHVLNDSYNANPDSMKASVQTFLGLDKPADCKKILVLGGMKELGTFTGQSHRELGEWLATQPQIHHLFTVGEEAAVIAEATRQARFETTHFLTVEALGTFLSAQDALLQNSIIYLKGSRAYHLDTLVSLLDMARPLSRQHHPNG